MIANQIIGKVSSTFLPFVVHTSLVHWKALLKVLEILCKWEKNDLTIRYLRYSWQFKPLDWGWQWIGLKCGHVIPNPFLIRGGFDSGVCQGFGAGIGFYILTRIGFRVSVLVGLGCTPRPLSVHICFRVNICAKLLYNFKNGALTLPSHEFTIFILLILKKFSVRPDATHACHRVGLGS